MSCTDCLPSHASRQEKLSTQSLRARQICRSALAEARRSGHYVRGRLHDRDHPGGSELIESEWDRDEIELVLTRYWQTMSAARRGESSFEDAAGFYTEHAVYDEPLAGRVTGRDAIVKAFTQG